MTLTGFTIRPAPISSMGTMRISFVGQEFLTFGTGFPGFVPDPIEKISGVGGLRNYLKIFKSVIKCIPVFVMDYLRRERSKFAAQVLFHNIPALWNLLSVYSNQFISVTVNSAATVSSFLLERGVTIVFQQRIVVATQATFAPIRIMCRVITAIDGTYLAVIRKYLSLIPYHTLIIPDAIIRVKRKEEVNLCKSS